MKDDFFYLRQADRQVEPPRDGMAKLLDPTLDELLEQWSVHPPGGWENDDGPKDWFAVSHDDRGVIAYFAEERDAFRFRLDQINRTLNP